MLAVEHDSPTKCEQCSGTLINSPTYHIDNPLLNVLNPKANKEVMDASWCFPLDTRKTPNLYQ